MRNAAGLRVFTQASSRLKPVPLKSVACIQWSWLKPVPLKSIECIQRDWLHATHVGLALAGKASGVTPQD